MKSIYVKWFEIKPTKGSVPKQDFETIKSMLKSHYKNVHLERNKYHITINFINTETIKIDVYDIYNKLKYSKYRRCYIIRPLNSKGSFDSEISFAMIGVPY